MADLAISELIAAESILPNDLFVLEQDHEAKKLRGQVLLNWLTAAADGHGGIADITGPVTDGLVDTYTILLADQTTKTFTVTNGKGVTEFEKVSTNGLVDTWRMSFGDGTHVDIPITNGAKGDKGDNAYVHIKWASQEPTAASHDFGDLPDDWIGICSNSTQDAPVDWTAYQWFLYKGQKGDTGDPATVNDLESSVMYATSSSGTIIPDTWQTGIPVVTAGNFLWSRAITKFNTGDPVTVYGVSRYGIDGSGAVSAVAGKSPDGSGNVALVASDVGAMPSAGGSFTGPVDMNGQKLSGLNSPSQNDEAATKGYVDGRVGAIPAGTTVKAYVDGKAITTDTTLTIAGAAADAKATGDAIKNTLPVLLWENASPTSEFPPQSIEADLSDFCIVFIRFRRSTSTASYITLPFTTGQSNQEATIIAYARSSGRYSETYNRAVGVLDSEISFTNCTQKKFSEANTSVNDSGEIPVQIYGIKNVR